MSCDKTPTTFVLSNTHNNKMLLKHCLHDTFQHFSLNPMIEMPIDLDS